MGTLLIRKIDEKLKGRLRVRAARKGHSMEEEARRILADALAPAAPPVDNIADAIRRIIDPVGGIELERLPRQSMREPLRFDD
jgi:plasmid stability protein